MSNTVARMQVVPLSRRHHAQPQARRLAGARVRTVTDSLIGMRFP